jgi:glycosyltransferase involved in cell wall biosynthesis
MKLLFLSHEIPSPAVSDLSVHYHHIRDLSKLYGHNITVISFASERSSIQDLEHLKSFCSIEDTVKMKRQFMKLPVIVAKNGIHNLPKNIKHGLLVNELDYFYDRRMEQKIQEAVKKDTFDLILSTRHMANYVVDIDVPKIVCPLDAMFEQRRQVFVNSEGLQRAIYGLRYVLNRSHEKHIYEAFDACLVVTQQDKMLLESLNPRIHCVVVPVGVDVAHFSPIDRIEEPSSLVFVSAFQYPPQVANVLHFYNEIFPLIRKKNPEVKLYLVGRDPVKEVVDLSADPSVFVTGYVEDVRPYLEKSTVFVAPIILGTGMKTKVVEAMSMGKAIVTTTLGVQGIAVKNKKHVVVADNPNEFARATISLLKDQQARATLGANARKLVEERYSWETMAKALNESLYKVLSQRG